MSEHIRSSIDAASILQSTVAEVRQFLKTDRVLIYRCQDWASQLDGKEQKGAIVAGEGLPLGYRVQVRRIRSHPRAIVCGEC